MNLAEIQPGVSTSTSYFYVPISMYFFNNKKNCDTNWSAFIHYI